MSQDRKGFTVNDRRHFAPDGSVRDEADDAGATQPSGPEARANTPPRADVDLSSFLLSLAEQASALLGLVAPEGEKPRVDLGGARSMIGILEMLQSKTEGRRTPEEDRLLEGLLYQLRMAYVARAREKA